VRVHQAALGAWAVVCRHGARHASCRAPRLGRVPRASNCWRYALPCTLQTTPQGLTLWRDSLAQEKYLDEATARVRALEAEILALRNAQATQDQHVTDVPDGVTVKDRGLTKWTSEDGKDKKYWFRW
jgi:hypothetical protein